MTSLEHVHHRISMAAAALLAVATGVLLLVLGTADDAAGRGDPPVGDGTGGVDFLVIGEGGFEMPVNVAFAPGQPNNVYVVEQDGTVEVLVNNVENGEFLDIRDKTNGSGERGLLGLAFHPDYATNDLVYAYYTHAGTGDIVVSEFEAPDPLDADESTARRVIRIRHRMASNHNGGQLLFGPDDRLYMGTGDGGAGGDPRENAQDKQSLLGKLLRINPLDPPGERSYTTPQANPYKGKKGRDEILARGLRNPFRFSFDGDLIAIGDVGQNRFEEVDYEGPQSLRGANFGWDRWEGRQRYREGDEARTPKPKHHDKPIHVYGHGEGCSITGGVVVRDGSLTNLFGRYLYADFCAGQLRSFVPALGGAQGDRALDEPPIDEPTSFTTNPFDSRVYVTSLNGDGDNVWVLAPEAP
jgi:glucose/arabinose dehydrogenase